VTRPNTAQPDPSDHPAVEQRTLADIMSEVLHTVAPNLTLADAARHMNDAHVSSLIVLDDGLPVGILTERDMLRHLALGTPHSVRVKDVMSAPVVTARPDTPFAEAWGQMSARNLRHLVVVEASGTAMGLVSEGDFRRHVDTGLLAQLGELNDLIEYTLPNIAPSATIDEALQLMVKHASTYVIATQDARPVGLLTERDMPGLLMRAESLRPGATLYVADVMHNTVPTIPPGTTLLDAAMAMQSQGSRHLAVVNGDGTLLGMVQQHSLMARLGTALERWYLHDLDATQRSEVALADQRYHMAADAAQLGYWEYDIAHNRISYSGQLQQMFDGRTTPATGPVGIQALFDRIHPDQTVQVQRIVSLALLSLDPQASPIDTKYQMKCHDGSWRWVHTRGRVVKRDAAGLPTHAMGVTMDIQQHKADEAALVRANQEISRRQAMLELLSDSVNRSPVVAIVWSLSEGWPVDFVTQNVSQWGYDRAEFMAGGLLYESLVHPDDLPRINKEIADYLAIGQDSYDQRYRVRAASGRWIWLEDHTRIQRDASGQVTRAHGMLTDVTEQYTQQRAEQVERNFLEGMARGVDLKELLTTLLAAYEELLPDTMGSVLLLDNAGQHVHNLAAPSLPATYTQAIEGAAIGPQVGSCGTAAYRGETVVVADIATDPLWADYKSLALAHGLKACWSVPFKNSQGKVMGTFALYSLEPRAPRPHEIKTLEHTAYLTGLAVERAHDQATLSKLWLAVEQSPHSIVITDLKSRIEYVNQAFYAATGYSPQEVLGSNPSLLQSGKTDPLTYEMMWEHLRQGKPWQGEFINRRKDGTEYVEAVRLSPVKQHNGTVTHYLAIKEDITQRKAAEQQIHKLAYFDALTGLPNRLLLADRFNQALSMAKRQSEPMTLMFLDLDHFKNVNDTLGHPAGDALLVEATRRLSATVRAGDTLSRQGGDEFVLLLPDCNALQAAHVAQKLMDSMVSVMHIEGHDVAITLSIGIAIYPTDGTDFNAMSKSADVAMYRAKEEGRNGYRFFTSDMQVRSSRTLTLESHLRRALERNELQLVYQPQVSLANGQLVGVEALLRWHHPTLGVVSPVEFIPMAESSGLILPIGEWVLRTAAQQLKDWMNQGLGRFAMAVNLSAVQFRDATLSTLVASVLHELTLPPDCLELELTESVAMSDPLGAVVAIDELNALGVHMAIDDFGTGYSSLSYLKRFKVDKLKIDKSFVQDITTDPDDKAIASAIISLASSLGLRTIAEGVETPGQLAWLRMQGCDEAQGYFFSPPVSATELVAWARTQGLVPS
jgi:diguanylate cyclase (GGDEF)-like protein/PAS domain S-box-containing protein